MHLVQEEDLIRKIHEEEIPPEIYYVELEAALRKKFPGVTDKMLKHSIALTAAFDTAIGFGISFGISKFQLAQESVKLVGEIVGTFGRRPNPELVQATKKWPPIKDLKDLQSFLGTTKYVRPHAGPAYARVMAPSRALLKPDVLWPLNPDQLKSIQGLEDLLKETHTLAVPDEAAAIRAAAAWLAGASPEGRPL